MTASSWTMDRRDVSASFVVFLVALPLCMGIAIASGMPPTAGLVTGIVGGIFVGAISGSPLQVSGPAAGLSVIVWGLVQSYDLASVGLIIFLAGVMQAISGLLRVGQLFRAISPGVIYGMLAGIGILICGSQFHVMADAPPFDSGWTNLTGIPETIWLRIVGGDAAHRAAACIGLLTIATTIAWGMFRPERLRVVPPAVAGVVAAVVAAAFLGSEISYVSIPSSLWDSLTFASPAALLDASGLQLLGPAFVLMAIASAETLLCAAAVDRMQDEVRTDYDRELFAQGVGNAICGILGGLPMTGVIVRSSANVGAGGKTRASTMLHGLWLLLLVAVFPGVLQWVPTASLAGVLVYTGLKLVNLGHLRELQRYGWGSVVVYAATGVGVVGIDLLSGVLLGLALSALRLLFQLGRFRFDVHSSQGGARLDVQLRGAVTFLGLPRLAALLEEVTSASEIHFRADQLTYVDHACLVAIEDFQRLQNKRGKRVFIDWVDLEARSEKTSVARAPTGVPRLQPS